MIVPSVRVFATPAFVLGAFFAFSFCGTASSASAAEAEAVTIDTTFSVKTPPVRLVIPPPPARASVVLMTGGNGLLSLDSTGTIIDSTGNFLIRSANLFLHHGLNVMMADALPAHPAGLDNTTRLSSAHAAELQGFITAALTRWNKPVWVIGTSNGSVSTVTAGGFQPALSGLAGVVMTSPVTVLPSASQPTFNLYASRITFPALVVWEANDHCTFSPPAGSANLFSLIPSHHKARRSLEFAHSVATDPCGAFSEHGYAGIEEEVVREIAAFILGERW
jgi:hypothetical protein